MRGPKSLVADVNGWRCWYRVIARPWEATNAWANQSGRCPREHQSDAGSSERIGARYGLAVQRRLIEHVLPREFNLDPAGFEVTVGDGIVTLRGEVPLGLLIHPLIEAVRRTAGVIAVHDHLTYAVDDSVLPPRQPVP